MKSKPRKPISYPDWHEFPLMAVQGSIDSHGAIRAKASKEVEFHSLETSRGKRWRFTIWSQEFHYCAPRSLKEDQNRQALRLTEEEEFLVCDWLIKNGYADNRILPQPPVKH